MPASIHAFSVFASMKSNNHFLGKEWRPTSSIISEQLTKINGSTDTCLQFHYLFVHMPQLIMKKDNLALDMKWNKIKKNKQKKIKWNKIKAVVSFSLPWLIKSIWLNQVDKFKMLPSSAPTRLDSVITNIPPAPKDLYRNGYNYMPSNRVAISRYPGI